MLVISFIFFLLRNSKWQHRRKAAIDPTPCTARLALLSTTPPVQQMSEHNGDKAFKIRALYQQRLQRDERTPIN